MIPYQQENIPMMKRKYQSTESNPEVIHRINSVDKDIKSTIINILYILKEIEESTSMLRRDMEDTKKIQTELLEMKNIIYDITCNIHQMGQTGELTMKKKTLWNSNLYSPKWNKGIKKTKISEWRISDLLFNFKLPNTHTIGGSEEERKDGTGKIFE